MNKLKTYTEGNVLVMEREFNAPRELVFQAFSNSELLASWWGPKGWETENRQFDFQPSGVWHYCMTCKDENQGEFYGQQSWGKAIFKEIVPPEKIVYTDFFSDEHGNEAQGMPGLHVTVLFEEVEGKTKLISRTEFDSNEDLKKVMEMGVVQGYGSQLERLEEMLEKINA